MAENMNDMEECHNAEALWSRRAVLKIIAGAPLVITFALVASPLMRFLKPTMKPGNFFQAADLPEASQPPLFHISDFPETWTCLPFMFPMKYLIFNPEQSEIRQIPGFVIRVGINQIVAYSRICPKQHDHILKFASVHPRVDGSCGCRDTTCKGACIGYAKTPVLICPCDHSVFDVSNNGTVLRGPAFYPARQFTVDRDGDWISINRLEQVGIA
jgi:nitrite reductase/ring-hydroxylating ferredoxin subunit